MTKQEVEKAEKTFFENKRLRSLASIIADEAGENWRAVYAQKCEEFLAEPLRSALLQGL